LSRLNGQVEAMRAVLIRLLQDVVVAEKRLDSSAAAQLVEANEALIVAALRSQGVADTAQQALDEASATAELDALTGLPNRLLLLDRFNAAIAGAGRRGTCLALLFVDLDNFKQINDTLGHAVGDEALKQVARYLVSCVRAADTVSRHGGDEFLVLLTEISHVSGATLVADKILALLNTPCRLGDHRVSLGASIGISLYPDDGDDPLTLIAEADAAMYRAKQGGNSVVHGAHPASGAHAPVAAPSAGRCRGLAPASAQQSDGEAGRAQWLQEANEQLVLAALDAQELQAAAQSAQRRQAEFLAVMAHELRNPLAPIRLAASQLGMAHADDPLLSRAQAIIDRQTARIERLVGDLLDASRGRPVPLRIEPRRVLLAPIVETAVAACRAAMNGRAQRFTLQMPAAEAHVHADAARLAQALTNLLDNASKYTPDGGTIDLAVLAGEAEIRSRSPTTASASPPRACLASSMRSCKTRTRSGSTAAASASG
jgi:diguanylate cyclase